MDLADELLLDLEEDVAQDDAQTMAEDDFKMPQLPATGTKRRREDIDEDMGVSTSMDAQDDSTGQRIIEVIEGGIKPAEELDAETVENTDLRAVADVNGVARLATNRAFTQCLEVRKFS